MDLLAVFVKFWEFLAANPLATMALSVAVATLAATITRVLLSGALEASKERNLGFQDDIRRLSGEKSDLLQRLEAHGDDIGGVTRIV